MPRFSRSGVVQFGCQSPVRERGLATLCFIGVIERQHEHGPYAGRVIATPDPCAGKRYPARPVPFRSRTRAMLGGEGDPRPCANGRVGLGRRVRICGRGCGGSGTGTAGARASRNACCPSPDRRMTAASRHRSCLGVAPRAQVGPEDRCEAAHRCRCHRLRTGGVLLGVCGAGDRSVSDVGPRSACAVPCRTPWM